MLTVVSGVPGSGMGLVSACLQAGGMQFPGTPAQPTYNGYNDFESNQIRQMMESIWKDGVSESSDRKLFVTEVKNLFGTVLPTIDKPDSYIGIKHTNFSKLIFDLNAGFHPALFVYVRRPLHECVESIVRMYSSYMPEDIARERSKVISAIALTMFDGIKKYAKFPIVEVSYSHLLDNTEQTLFGIWSGLGLSEDEAQQRSSNGTAGIKV